MKRAGGIGTLLVAAVLAIVGWALVDARRAAGQQAAQQEGNIALTLDDGIGRTVASLDASLQAAVRGMAIPGLAGMDPLVRQSILFDGALAAEDYGGVFITNEQGRVIYSALSPHALPIDVADRPYFIAQRDHPGLGLVISRPVVSRSDGSLSLPIARRISRADGSFGGVAMALLRVSYFQTLFGAIDLGDHGIVNLLSTDGFLVTRRPYVAADVGRDMAGSEMFSYLAKSPAGHFEARASIDGLTRLYTYRRIGSLPLVLGVGFSVHDVYADWTRKAAIVGGAVLLLAGVYVLLVWRLQGELARRMTAEGNARQAGAASEQLSRDLTQALAPLEALFRNSADAMLSVLVTPGGDFVYETVNAAWQELSGVASRGAIGRRAAEAVPAAMAATDVANWRHCVRERRPVRYVLSGAAPSGERAWERLVVPVHEADGPINRLIIVARETTEQSRLEEQVRQGEKMQINGHIAASVSHDFNNILQTVLSGVELLRDERLLSGPGHKFLDVIGQATARGAALSHHLLSFARQQRLNFEAIDPREVLERLRVILPRTLGSHISVVTEVAEPVGLVQADRAQLETALMHLAINAAHAMPSGGRVQIAVSGADAVCFAGLNPGRYLVIAVSDSGSGMAADVLARIFEPFFTTKGPGASGLGLAMVQGFCRQSGGDVRAASRLGHGTELEIWLPEVALSSRVDGS